MSAHKQIYQLQRYIIDEEPEFCSSLVVHVLFFGEHLNVNWYSKLMKTWQHEDEWKKLWEVNVGAKLFLYTPQPYFDILLEIRYRENMSRVKKSKLLAF